MENNKALEIESGLKSHKSLYKHANFHNLQSLNGQTCNHFYNTTKPLLVSVFVCVCAYLFDLGGACQQVMNVVVELYLSLYCHLLDVCATEHHLVREAGERQRS